MVETFLGQWFSSAKRNLLQRQLQPFVRPRNKFVAHNDAGAGIPAQKRIVVSRRTYRFSFFVPTHRFAQEMVSFVTGARAALMEAGFGTTLGDDSGVISPLVWILEPGHKFLGLDDAYCVAFAKSVGQGQQQNDQCLLVLRVDPQHVVTNALGLTRLVEQAVSHGFFERSRDSLWSRKRFEFEHGPTLST